MSKEECPGQVSGSKEVVRSYVGPGSYITPEPKYVIGEQAFIGYEDPRRAKAVVLVASEGRWNREKQQYEYLLTWKQHGTWFEEGDWIEEGRLNSNP